MNRPTSSTTPLAAGGSGGLPLGALAECRFQSRAADNLAQDSDAVIMATVGNNAVGGGGG